MRAETKSKHHAFKPKWFRFTILGTYLQFLLHAAASSLPGFSVRLPLGWDASPSQGYSQYSVRLSHISIVSINTLQWRGPVICDSKAPCPRTHHNERNKFHNEIAVIVWYSEYRLYSLMKQRTDLLCTWRGNAMDHETRSQRAVETITIREPWLPNGFLKTNYCI